MKPQQLAQFKKDLATLCETYQLDAINVAATKLIHQQNEFTGEFIVTVESIVMKPVPLLMECSKVLSDLIGSVLTRGGATNLDTIKKN